MATRSNILLADEHGNELWLYRHWDGYPACNGLRIAQILKRLGRNYGREYGTFAPLANALLAERDNRNCPDYEITCGQHGDIEWLYEIRCSGKKV